MSDKVFCGECGTVVPAASKFCTSCGSKQEPIAPAATEPTPPTVGLFKDPHATPTPTTPPPPAASPPPSPGPSAADAARQAAQRIDQLNPGASDLTSQLATQLKTPAVTVAGIVALYGLAASLVVAIIVAVLTPGLGDGVPSALSFAALDESRVSLGEILRLTVAETLARPDFPGRDSVTYLPMIFTIVPIGAIAFGMRREGARLADVDVRTRFATSLLVVVPFVCLLLLVALLGKADVEGQDIAFKYGSVILAGTLIAACGALVGTWLSLRDTAPETLSGLLPPVAVKVLQAVRQPLRTGVIAVVLSGLLLTFYAEVQIIRGQESVKTQRSTVAAVVETPLFAPEFGLTVISLGTIGTAKDAVFVPSDDAIEKGDAAKLTEDHRIFDYSGPLSIIAFLPILVLTVGIPLLLALYGGFATARAVGAPSPGLGAAWGALVGVVWSLSFVLLRSLNAFTGATVSGDSLFVSSLLFGAIVGAIGGFLATQQQTAASPPGVAPRV